VDIRPSPKTDVLVLRFFVAPAAKAAKTSLGVVSFESNNTTVKLEEASTQKSAKTHTGNVCATRDLDL